jgi:hypothetical protein
MKPFLRNFAATLLALLAAFTVIVAVEIFGDVVHPLPKDHRVTMEEMCAHVEKFPTWALAAVVPMWAFAALASAWIAKRIGNTYSVAIVGLLLLAGLVLNLSMLPYPIWFKVATLVAMPAAIFAGSRFLQRRKIDGKGEAGQGTALL